MTEEQRELLLKALQSLEAAKLTPTYEQLPRLRHIPRLLCDVLYCRSISRR
jgi:hypothetical protein